MNKTLLYIVLGCTASLAFIGWRAHAMKTQATPQFEIVEDLSLSHARGCESLVGLAERVLDASGVSQNSTLTVLVVGDETTADEPWRLARYSIPVDDEVLEGRAEKRHRQQALLGDLRSRCRAARRTTISPIFLAVKQAVADLHARGCKPNSGCTLFVDSDLEENVEPSIKKSINDHDGGHIPLPPIDNEGINVTFCGLAVRAGRVEPSARQTRGTVSILPGDADRIPTVWRSLFRRPEEVRFGPYCPIPQSMNTRD